MADALPAATSQAVSQAVDKAVAAQLRATLPTALSAAFTSSVLPAFERATAAMFGQIQDTFASGLSGHLATASGASQAVAASLQESAKQVWSCLMCMRGAVLAPLLLIDGPPAVASECWGDRMARLSCLAACSWCNLVAPRSCGHVHARRGV